LELLSAGKIDSMAAKSPYSPELRRRAAYVVGEIRHQYRKAAIIAVAAKLGIGTVMTF
jgi:hypothetical protein